MSKIISKKSWIKPEKVAAFYVDQGKLLNIIDPELKLIKVEEIDRASSLINHQFDRLFDLELSVV